MANMIEEKISQLKMFNGNKNVDYDKYKHELEMRKHELEIKEAEDLGVTIEDYGHVLTKYNTIEDVKSIPPKMVLADCLMDMSVKVNKIFDMYFKKSDVLCMQLGLYRQILLFNNKVRQLKPHVKKFKDVFKRYNGENLDNKKLLIWRFGGIGDIMFIQPIVKYLKEKYPTSTIIMAVGSDSKPILDLWPKGLLKNTFAIPFHKKMLDQADYHLTFEGVIERCREAEHTNCYELFMKNAGLDFNLWDYPITLNLDKSKLEKYKKFIPSNTIILQMKSSSPIRTMSYGRWVPIIEKLHNSGYNVAILDSSNNFNMYEEFKLQNNIPYVINLCQYSKNIIDATYLLELSKGVIGIDSSIIHVASALNKPVLGIYGPFKGVLRLKYYKNATWIEKESYDKCKHFPCFIHHSEINKCPFYCGNVGPGCMDEIDSDDIFNKFIEHIQKF